MSNTHSNPSRKTGLNRLLGEYKWVKYLSFVASIGCFAAAFSATGVGVSIIRDPAFQTGMLFSVLTYLSDLRYNLIPESRND